MMGWDGGDFSATLGRIIEIEVEQLKRNDTCNLFTSSSASLQFVHRQLIHRTVYAV
jgi:hypothetical protein